MAIANKPRDHHYIPVFYLKQWCGADKKIIEYTVKHTSFIAKPVGPRGTGFETDLYAFPELPPELAQHMEDVFLKYADNAASVALRKLLTGAATWTAENRSGWSRFLISLLIRHPDVMLELRKATIRSWEKAGPKSQARYEATKEQHHPPTFDEYVATIDPLIPIKVSLNAIIKAVDNERLGAQLNSMYWGVIDLSKSPFPLLTSDRPLQHDSLKLPKGFISLPISPNKLFFASNNSEAISSVRALKPRVVARQVNLWVVSRARRFVFAHDGSQASFVEKYIHANMEPTPLLPGLDKLPG
jgi:hypothetical protein